ncbi:MULTISPECIES: hypothetical protein [unclassified Sphingomonas]|uniref:hypothetical protein n=1 Tax=unclassified Sphingomonas TaxID=196159 RepID=UPI0010F455B7|nr:MULTISPECIES: hypothetical protein [unclassified Sphingomonas]
MIEKAGHHETAGESQQHRHAGSVRAGAALTARLDRRLVSRSMAARGGGLDHALGHCRGAAALVAAMPDHFVPGGDFFPFLGPDRAEQVVAATDAQ